MCVGGFTTASSSHAPSAHSRIMTPPSSVGAVRAPNAAWAASRYRRSPAARTRAVLIWAVIGLVVLLLAIQLVPYGRDHTNPAGGKQIAWDSLRTKRLMTDACMDCHSNETRWPWYSSFPVASWLIERDVTEGRGQLNFSRWTQYNNFDRADLLDKACELATKREMPLWQYRLAHREARLNEPEIAALCAWTQREAKRLVGDGS